MIECEIVHSGFSQGGIDTKGENYNTTWAVKTDFAEIPYGLQTISVDLSVGRKIWKPNEKTYEDAETTTGTAYVYFYDENKAFVNYAMIYNNAKPITVDFFNYLNVKYVRLYVPMSSDTLNHDDTQDTKESY